MFTDPQSVTVNTVAKSLPRISTEALSSKYLQAEGEFQLRISHQETKNRIRRMVRLDQTIIAADTLTAVNTRKTAGVYLVIDEPAEGFTDAQLGYLVDALKAWFTAGNTAKVLASES